MVNSWHGEIDKSGNTNCKKCGEYQSAHFDNCIYCCPHNNLNMVEDWDNGWHICFECSDCGKNFGFRNEDVIKQYKLVRKEDD